MVGTVAKRGSDVTANEWVEGDRVMAIFKLNPSDGADHRRTFAFRTWSAIVLSEYGCFPAYGLAKVPSFLSDEEGSTLPIAAVTAWMALNWMRPIGQPVRGADHVVLLQGTGGVSIAGLQLAKASGLTAIVTSSSDEKLNRAKELGADHVIDYKATPEWQDKVMQITERKGVDVIFEQGDRRDWRRASPASNGEDDADSRINVNVLALRRNVTLKGIWNGPKDRLEEAVELYRQKGIHPVVDKVFTFDRAREALEYVAVGSYFGKVVVNVA